VIKTFGIVALLCVRRGWLRTPATRGCWVPAVPVRGDREAEPIARVERGRAALEFQAIGPRRAARYCSAMVILTGPPFERNPSERNPS
jgi:hypothetical protein